MTEKGKRLRREGASKYLLDEWGISRTPNTLAKLAVIGGSPPFEKDGRIPLYTEEGLDEWARDLAPTTELRKWFNHVEERWDEFRRKYLAELAAPEQQARLEALLQAAGKRPLTLLYGAHDAEHNQAVVLRDALLDYAQRHGKRHA